MSGLVTLEELVAERRRLAGVTPAERTDAQRARVRLLPFEVCQAACWDLRARAGELRGLLDEAWARSAVDGVAWRGAPDADALALGTVEVVAVRSRHDGAWLAASACPQEAARARWALDRFGAGTLREALWCPLGDLEIQATVDGVRCPAEVSLVWEMVGPSPATSSR